MNLKNSPARANIIPSCLCILLAIASAGCVAYQAKTSVTPTQLRAVEKSPAKIALVLESSFTGYEAKFHRGLFSAGGYGDQIYKVGPQLKDYALNVTQNRFSEVATFPTETAAAGSSDAILIPKVSKILQHWGFGFGSKLSMVLAVEWTLKDSSGQRVLATIPISVDAEVPQGNAFQAQSRMGELTSKLFENLSTATQDAFVKSPEIANIKK